MAGHGLRKSSNADGHVKCGRIGQMRTDRSNATKTKRQYIYCEKNVREMGMKRRRNLDGVDSGETGCWVGHKQLQAQLLQAGLQPFSTYPAHARAQ